MCTQQRFTSRDIDVCLHDIFTYEYIGNHFGLGLLFWQPFWMWIKLEQLWNTWLHYRICDYYIMEHVMITLWNMWRLHCGTCNDYTMEHIMIT